MKFHRKGREEREALNLNCVGFASFAILAVEI